MKTKQTEDNTEEVRQLKRCNICIMGTIAGKERIDKNKY